MTTLRALVARSWRQGRAGWLLVALLTALTVAGSAGALAAARRTITAYPRALDVLAGPDATVGIGVPEDVPGAPPSLDLADLPGLPGVVEVGVSRVLLAAAVTSDGAADPTSPLGVSVALDDRIWRTIDRPLLRHGRLPAIGAADEVAISSSLAERAHLDVGDRLRMRLFTFEQVDALSKGDGFAGELVQPRVVGVVQPTAYSAEDDAPFVGDVVLGSGALLLAHPGTGTYRVAAFRLEDGQASVPALTRALEGQGAALDLRARASVEDEVRRVVGPEAVALGLVGGLVAAFGLVLVLLSAARQVAEGREEAALLAAIGISRRQRSLAGWTVAASSVTTGTLIGAGLAVTGSTLGPIGPIRVVDPDRGLRLDPVVHVALPLLLAAAAAVVIALLAWRAAAVPRPTSLAVTGARRPGRAGRGPAWLAVARAVRTTAGRRLVRSLAGGVTVTVVVVVVIGALSASIDHLLATPRLFGHGYDLAAWDGYDAIPDDTITSLLRGDGDVAAISRVAELSGAVDGLESRLFGFEDPALGPSVITGRAPAAPGEVLLGRRLAAHLGVGVGDDVTVVAGAATAIGRVVGVGVLPADGGSGAGFTLEGLRAVNDEAQVGFQYVDVVDGADPAAVRARFLDHFDGCSVDCELEPPRPPSDVAHLAVSGAFPSGALAAVGLGGLAGAVHGVVRLGRRNRRALATILSLGATRAQATRCLVVQASTALGAGLVFGGLLGWAGARSLWGWAAARLGVVQATAVPWQRVSAMLVAFVLVLELITVLSARSAARRNLARELAAA